MLRDPALKRYVKHSLISEPFCLKSGHGTSNASGVLMETSATMAFLSGSLVSLIFLKTFFAPLYKQDFINDVQKAIGIFVPLT